MGGGGVVSIPRAGWRSGECRRKLTPRIQNCHELWLSLGPLGGYTYIYAYLWLDGDVPISGY